MQLSIIIVNYNVAELLQRNLKRLRETIDVEGIQAEVIVVDNNSQDGSVEVLKEEFSWASSILNDENLGFAKAVNQGVSASSGEVVLLLNPDMYVSSECLKETYKACLEKNVGVVGGRLVDERDGSTIPSVRRDPQFMDQLITILKLPHVFPWLVRRYLCKGFDYSVSQSVEQVRGSYFAFSREVFNKVGSFDEQYYLWFEEVDFCKRVRKSGRDVIYRSDIEVIDLYGRSFAQVSLYKKQRILFDSLIAYFKKWHPHWQSVMFTIIRPIMLASAYVISKLKLL